MGIPPASGSSGREPPEPAGALPAPRQRFGRALRIRASGAFAAALQRGGRAGDDLIRVWVLRRDAGATRLGLVVGRRNGPAVRRNRLKRLIREAFRQVHAELASGLEIVCGPHPGVEPTLAGLRESLRRLVPLAEKRQRN